jgi:hypothetical protein
MVIAEPPSPASTAAIVVCFRLAMSASDHTGT